MEPVLSLPLKRPTGEGRNLLRSLHAQLRELIVTGRLHGGSRLPSSRELATALGIGRNTVVALYELLASAGYVHTRPGGGTFVSNIDAGPVTSTTPLGRGPDPRLAPWLLARPLAVFSGLITSARYDFTPGVPDEANFPFAIWRRLATRELRNLSRETTGYAAPEGLERLRAAVAGHVSVSRAVAAQGDQVLITSGAQQAFSLIAQVLVTPGKTVVAVESPGYPPLRQALEAFGATVVNVPVDDEGLVVQRIPRGTTVVCVTPSHQFPLGMAMSLPRRLELLAWARSADASIVEDDYDGEFRYGDDPLDALKTLDTDDRVFYVGTFSKTMFPSLRLGYVVAPAWARNALGVAKQLADWHCSLPEQATLGSFIEEGHLVRHLRKARKLYAARRATLLAAASKALPDWIVPRPSMAGLHVTFRCLRPINLDLQRQVAAAGIAAHWVRSPAGASDLILGFGRIPEPQIVPGIRTLGHTLASPAGRGRGV